MKIVMLGLKGVGKTTVGKSFATLIGWPFIDTDLEIEVKAGISPRDLFIQEGEKKLREVEHEVLSGLEREDDCVIALGGGTFLPIENQKMLRTLGILICLHLSKQSLLERWREWPAVCARREDFDRYYEERVEKLSHLSCIWIDATREDLMDVLMKVSFGN